MALDVQALALPPDEGDVTYPFYANVSERSTSSSPCRQAFDSRPPQQRHVQFDRRSVCGAPIRHITL